MLRRGRRRRQDSRRVSEELLLLPVKGEDEMRMLECVREIEAPVREDVSVGLEMRQEAGPRTKGPRAFDAR